MLFTVICTILCSICVVALYELSTKLSGSYDSTHRLRFATPHGVPPHRCGVDMAAASLVDRSQVSERSVTVGACSTCLDAYIVTHAILAWRPWPWDLQDSSARNTAATRLTFSVGSHLWVGCVYSWLRGSGFLDPEALVLWVCSIHAVCHFW